MTKPACRLILSSAPLLNRDSRHARSNPSHLQRRENIDSTGSTMPPFVNPHPPTLTDHCYEFPAISPSPLTTPKTVPTWQGSGPTSDGRHLPTRPRSRYECPDEHYSCPFGRSIVGREPGSPWAEAKSYEASPPTFFPTSTDSYYQLMGTPTFGDGGSQWNMSDYASHLGDYPTPQSNLSLSPPQQARGHTGLSGRYVAASGSTASQQGFEDLGTFETPCPQTLGTASPGEAESSYQQEDEKQKPYDECDDSDGDGSVHCEPYAQLIFRALKNAPGHAMVLKDIYRWFERNTDKARKSSKGWQNSIRHNLSMNGVRLPSG